MKTKNLLRNTMINTGMVIVILLILPLWPIRKIDQSLQKAGRWLLSLYR